MPYEELAAASAARLTAEKEEAMNEAYTQVGTAVTRGVHLVSVLDRPSAALDSPSSASAVAGASVSPAVRFRWQQQAEAPAYRSPRTPSIASRYEWSQREPNRLRLIRAVG